MTADTHGVVVARTGANKSLIIQVGNLDVPRTDFDRAVTGHREKRMHCRKMGIVGPHVDHAKVGAGQDSCATDHAGRHQSFNCSFHVRFSKPHPDTGDKTRLVYITALVAHHVCRVAIGAAPRNPDIGGKLPDNLVTQT